MAVDYFRVVLPGQPISWNHAYERATRYVEGRRIGGMFKTDAAKAFQEGIQHIVQAARPSAFRPAGRVIVAYEFYLSRAMDADNMLKLINDPIARAMGINDNRFLPVTMKLESPCKDPRVVVHIADAATWRVALEQIA